MVTVPALGGAPDLSAVHVDCSLEARAPGPLVFGLFCGARAGFQASELCANFHFPLESKIVFSTLPRSMSMPRSIEALENGRKKYSVRYSFIGRNRRAAVFGDRTIFILRAVDFSFVFDHRFFSKRVTHPERLR